MLALWDAFRIEGANSNYPIRDIGFDDAPSAVPAPPAIAAHLR
jgi:hypothetical protein